LTCYQISTLVYHRGGSNQLQFPCGQLITLVDLQVPNTGY